MTVRAKFKVESKLIDVNGTTINLVPVIGPSEENKNFYKWTPSGNIKLTVVKDETAVQFIIGDDYYVDFTPA